MHTALPGVELETLVAATVLYVVIAHQYNMLGIIIQLVGQVSDLNGLHRVARSGNWKL